MKARSLFTGIFLFICAGFQSAAEGQTQAPGALPEKAEVVGKEQTQEKALPPPPKNPEETEDNQPEKTWSLKVGGELTNYFVSESSAFFGDSARRWLETSLRLDGTASYKNFTVGFSTLGVRTTGQDAFGTGTIPAGAPPGTAKPSAWSRAKFSGWTKDALPAIPSMTKPRAGVSARLIAGRGKLPATTTFNAQK